MGRNDWKIPFKGGTKEYSRAVYLCRKHGRTWPELTEREKGGLRSDEEQQPAPKESFLLELREITTQFRKMTLALGELSERIQRMQ